MINNIAIIDVLFPEEYAKKISDSLLCRKIKDAVSALCNAHFQFESAYRGKLHDFAMLNDCPDFRISDSGIYQIFIGRSMSNYEKILQLGKVFCSEYIYRKTGLINAYSCVVCGNTGLMTEHHIDKYGNYEMYQAQCPCAQLESIKHPLNGYIEWCDLHRPNLLQ